jgi:hypothetical protein
MGLTMVFAFCVLMNTIEHPGAQATSWFAERDPVSTPARVTRASLIRLDEERIRSARIAIVSSLFLALVGAALLIVGHAAIDPLLQSAVAAREARGVGDLVYTMPDGIFCRHMSIDNMTGEISGGGIERCSGDISRGRRRFPSNFEWGGR